MDFINNYLLKNNVKEIKITKDRRSDSFNYRAEILTNHDENFYITLASHDTFLAKLDLTQREMGREPSNFIPVRYVNQSEQMSQQTMLQVALGGFFLVAFY